MLQMVQLRPALSCQSPITPALTPPTALRVLPVATQELSLGHGVAMAMGYLPLAALAPVHLRGPQGVAARLTVDGGRRVLKAGGIGHVAHHVIRLQFERVRRAVGEAPPEGSEEFVELMLPMRVAPRTQDAHRLVPGPERPAWGRVAVVQGELRFVQRGLDPG